MHLLEAMEMDCSFEECLKKGLNLDSVDEKTTELEFYPNSHDTLKFCRELFVRAKKLEKLFISTNFEASDYHRLLNDSSTAPGLLTSTIFGHMQPFSKCK